MGELQALIDAAKAGDEVSVRAIAAAHPETLGQRLESGESPLMAALYRGHQNVVAALTELGADVDVFAAAATGNVAALRTALAHGDVANTFAYDGWTPLHLAAFFGHSAAVRALVSAGAQIAAVSRNGLKNTPLHAATAAKHVEVALLLLDYGADPDAPDAAGFTPAQIAAENQLHQVLEAIARGRG